METNLFLIGLASLCCLFGVVALILVVQRSYRRMCMILTAQNLNPSVRSILMLRMQSGVACLNPFSKALMRNAHIKTLVDKVVDIARVKGLSISHQSSLTSFIACLLIVFVLVALIAQNLIAGLAVCICLTAATVIGLGSYADKVQNAVQEEVPVALELMTMCFGSGFTLLQTFQQIAHDMDGQLGVIFAQGAHILETGGSVSEALLLLKNRTDVPELAFVVAALEVQHQNGGAIGALLSTASESVKGELALKQSLRVQTAQAKLSARIVIIMPFILISLFSLISPGFMAPFFSSIAGFVLFGIALLMEVAGIVLVRRSLQIGGLS